MCCRGFVAVNCRHVAQLYEARVRALEPDLRSVPGGSPFGKFFRMSLKTACLGRVRDFSRRRHGMPKPRYNETCNALSAAVLPPAVLPRFAGRKIPYTRLY